MFGKVSIIYDSNGLPLKATFYPKERSWDTETIKDKLVPVTDGDKEKLAQNAGLIVAKFFIEMEKVELSGLQISNLVCTKGVGDQLICETWFESNN